jgi:hypothetical protein
LPIAHSRSIRGALSGWIARRSGDDARKWLESRLEDIRKGETDKPLFAALGRAPEILGKADLHLEAADFALAERCRPGWEPRAWSVDQAARLLLVLEAMAARDRPTDILERLFATADLRESVTLYRGLPLYPQPKHLADRAALGARSNVRTIFEAVAHNNPYPAEIFSEAAWNQMVVKALFIGSTLAPIQQLECRQNAELALMLRGYAHERWAAGRTVSPEVWRCVGRDGGAAALDDFKRLLESGSPLERRAAVLALAANGSVQARAMMQAEPDLARDVDSGTLTWTTLYETPAPTKGSPL